MTTDSVLDEIPSEEVDINGTTWTRDEYDTDSYQWTRPMGDDEYGWDPEADDISLVGTDVPIRAVELQPANDQWQVTASETAGPDYHRPGFTELISSEFSFETPSLEEAADKVKEYMTQLS